MHFSLNVHPLYCGDVETASSALVDTDYENANSLINNKNTSMLFFADTYIVIIAIAATMKTLISVVSTKGYATAAGSCHVLTALS